MHKGLDYPFHPKYWATEAWFWPGFVPWKMTFNGSVGNTYPWSAVWTSYNMVSDAGVVTPDSLKVRYSWEINVIGVADVMKLQLELAEISGVQYAHRHVWLELADVDIAHLYHFQTFPQRRCVVSGPGWMESDDPSDTAADQWLEFRPTTYAEGGSPW